MSAPTLTVFVATDGRRESLSLVLDSLLWAGLGEGDELLLGVDGLAGYANVDRCLDGFVPRFAGRTKVVYTPAPLGSWGHGLRNQYSIMAGGDYLLHFDDDDCYLPGAFDLVRGFVAPRPGKLCVFGFGDLFRVVPSDGVTEIKEGSISTQCGAIPNDPKRWGVWAPRYGGDAHFYQTCRFEVAFGGPVISVRRPHQIPGVWSRYTNRPFPPI